MQVEGHVLVDTTQKMAFELLTNPDVILRTVPGMRTLTATDDSFYEAELEVGVGQARERYRGKIQMVDMVPGSSYRLLMEGHGVTGFISADMVIALNGKGGRTDLHYCGEARVGGAVAGIGQRVLSGVARLMISQFFDSMAREISRRSNANHG